MVNLNLQKISRQITAKERAKLVVKLQLLSLSNITTEEMEKYNDGLISKPNPSEDFEIRQLVATCPEEQIDQYNFLIGLQRTIWDKIISKILDGLISLDLLEGSASGFKYQLAISPVIYFSTEKIIQTLGVVENEECESIMKCEGSINWVKFLKQLVFIEVSEQGLGTKKHTIKISSPEHDELLKSYVKRASEIIVGIYNQIALIGIIEDRHFDGMEIVNRNIESASFSTESVACRVNRFVDMHNTFIQDIIASFCCLNSGFYDFQLEGMEDYLILSNLQSNVVWVESKLKQIEMESRDSKIT